MNSHIPQYCRVAARGDKSSDLTYLTLIMTPYHWDGPNRPFRGASRVLTTQVSPAKRGFRQKRALTSAYSFLCLYGAPYCNMASQMVQTLTGRRCAWGSTIPALFETADMADSAVPDYVGWVLLPEGWHGTPNKRAVFRMRFMPRHEDDQLVWFATFAEFTHLEEALGLQAPLLSPIVSEHIGTLPRCRKYTYLKRPISPLKRPLSMGLAPVGNRLYMAVGPGDEEASSSWCCCWHCDERQCSTLLRYQATMLRILRPYSLLCNDVKALVVSFLSLRGVRVLCPIFIGTLPSKKSVAASPSP